MIKETEKASLYDNLEKMSTVDILKGINAQDSSVPAAVAQSISQIAALVDGIVERMERGGRVFYIGAGTSGRLGVTDASEIPPTYGVYDKFIGIIAGGDKAFRTAVEGAEDDPVQGWKDILQFNPVPDDTVIGISASGGAPYVVGALEKAREAGLLTACVCCNEDSPAAAVSDIPIVSVVGPEFVTGSTRMKSGTAAKLTLNMISTTVMIRLGHVHGNRMVDMQLSNTKLVDRGARMIMEESGIDDYERAKDLLLRYGSVRAAVDSLPQGAWSTKH